MERLDGYLKVGEAAEFLGVSPNTLRNWGREEKIPEFRHPVNNYRLYRRGGPEAILPPGTHPGRRAPHRPEMRPGEPGGGPEEPGYPPPGRRAPGGGRPGLRPPPP